VELCSATCARIKADASSKVRFMFGCSVDDVIPVNSFRDPAATIRAKFRT
jgi:hypothetical protein